MFYSVALILWSLGMWFTYEAMVSMGASNPLITALLVQSVLSFVQSLLLNDKYRLVPDTQKKIILIFAIMFLSFDTYMNYRGMYPRIGNIHAVMPAEIQQGIGVEDFNKLATWVLSFGVAVLPEILFNVGRSQRGGIGH